MMKKILFLNSCVEWGGGEKWTFDTAEELYKRGYEVIVASVAESELYQRSQEVGIKTKVVPVKGTLSVLNPIKLFSFVNYLKREEIDTIFLNLSQDLKFGALAGKLAGVEQIIYRRGSAIPIKDRFYTKFLLGNCVSDIIANSQATKDTILVNTSDWLKEDKIEIIYNGIKLDQVEVKAQGADIREEFGIKDDEILIANVGRLSKQKGHKCLIEAIDHLRKKIDNFKILLVGKGELEEELKKQVKELGLEDYIIFTGFRTDVYNIMSQIDFLLHTALWEGFGFVIAEAMAVAKTVVSTDVSNISEIIVSNKTGYLAKSKDPVDIAEKTLKMINNQDRDEMGQLAKQVIEDNFSFVDKVDELEELYLKNN
ncbi:glycosyltransferase [Orenia marismortui]|uniref:glycosyltransferase n=1 Tax=Orenia marismortui TaxID=46469 RepID=UPI00036D4663|nr:glycosyltransferase [Orenia marismortui]